MADPVADPYGLVGRKLDGRYDVEAIVAQGGFGVVYRGRHPMLGRPVAIKVLRDTGRDEGARSVFAELFLSEARVIAALEHPAVVRVIDYGVSPVGTGHRAPWMVLEWVDGRTLADELDARRGHGGRSPAECLSRLRPVFEALASAHEAGVAHRDIKPANVMIPARVSSGAPTARVLDFGVSKRMESAESAGSGQTQTRAEFTALSLPYASPEQVSFTRTGPWTDVHALALVLTEMLVDMAPYRGRDSVAVTAEVMAAERPTPARFGVDVGAWEPVLSRALSRLASERYPDAGAFLRALDESLPRARHEGVARDPHASIASASTLRARVLPSAIASSPRSFAAWTALFFALTAAPLVLTLVVAPLRARRASSVTPAVAPPSAPVIAPVIAPVGPPVITPTIAPVLAPAVVAAPESPLDAGAPTSVRTRSRRAPTTFHGLSSGQI